MILLDANLLLYAYDQESPKHQRAREILEGLLNSSDLVGLPWTSVWAFLRIATHGQIFAAPMSPDEACEAVSSWCQCPNVRLLSPGERHWDHLQLLVQTGQIRGALVMDAVLAAIAAEYGGEIWTSDRDFSRFEGIRWRNPL
ncbi:MAG: type II toxin-antitoxin system VapC family toxin [Armatimonadetes bacterium]|nr:type II toxin-antitoxin system VapC family toxin [Armatimonadota bacterium]